jgi:hypothetical protein
MFMINRFVLIGIIAFTSAMASLPVADANAATLLYSTGFSSPTYSDGPLIGQDSWVITGTSIVNPLSVSNSATDGVVTLGSSGQDVRRAFAPSIAGDSVFLSATVTLTSANATGDYFLHLGNNTDAGLFGRVYAKTTGSGFHLALASSSGTPAVAAYGTTVLPFNLPFSLLARYDIVSGLANDTGALFINPSDPMGVGDTPEVNMVNIGTDPTSLLSVGIRQGANTAFGTISSISISQVAAVPEPTSMALIGVVGVTGLAVRYRRKNASSSVAV